MNVTYLDLSLQVITSSQMNHRGGLCWEEQRGQKLQSGCIYDKRINYLKYFSPICLLGISVKTNKTTTKHYVKARIHRQLSMKPTVSASRYCLF